LLTLRERHLRAVARLFAPLGLLGPSVLPRARGGEARSQVSCRRCGTRIEKVVIGPALGALLPALPGGLRVRQRKAEPGQAGAFRLSRTDCARLVAAVKRVLRRSILTGGSSISDYVQPDGSDGEYQDERRVYDRAGEPCRRCRTPIRRIVIGQRAAHYCPPCQPG